MGNCFSGSTATDSGGLKVDTSRRSFSKRIEPWERTGMVAFRNSNLREFPPEVQLIAKKVRVLDATGNKIREVPRYIKLMTTCNRLGLSKNKISELPRGISALANLRVLLLDCNRLTCIPPPVFHLPKLERLDVSNNMISEISEDIKHMKALKSLDISNNRLQILPRELGECEALEELHASNNELSRLPLDLAKLEKLRLVVAESNEIASVPSEILMYCENLQTLALHGNPITIEVLESTKGYDKFEARRKAKWDKTVAAGVLLGQSRMKESADRNTKATKSGSTSASTTAKDISQQPLVSTADSAAVKTKKKSQKK